MLFPARVHLRRVALSLVPRIVLAGALLGVTGGISPGDDSDASPGHGGHGVHGRHAAPADAERS